MDVLEFEEEEEYEDSVESSEYEYEEDDKEEEEEIKYEKEEEEEEDSNFLEYNIDLAKKIGCIKKNVLFMLQDRGIDIGEEKEFISLPSLDVFCKCIQNKKKNFFSMEYEKKILVHFIIKSNKKKVCLKDVKDIFQKKSYQTLLIVPDKLSFDSNLEIQKYKNVEIFSYDFFLFSLPRHEYIPNHSPLTPQEKKDFLSHRNLFLNQLPLLRSNDPIVKYYGWKKDTIIKIQRPGWIVYRVIQ